MSLGQLIKKRRGEKKLSQRALAKMLNLSPSAVAQWELDITKPDATRWPIVCVMLDIDVARDLSESEQPPPQFVSEPDELALLGAFRLMKADMKVAMMKVFIGRLGDGGSERGKLNNAA